MGETRFYRKEFLPLMNVLLEAKKTREFFLSTEQLAAVNRLNT